MAVKIQIKVLWVVTPCVVVVGYKRFRAPCCLRFHTLEPEDEGSLNM
jgi:hypothetical protein